MAGAIVSSNIGNAIAGGIVIPQPVPASYATWPDIAKKEAADVLAIFNQRLNLGGEDPDDLPDGGNGTQPVIGQPIARTAALLSPAVIALVVIFFLLYHKS